MSVFLADLTSQQIPWGMVAIWKHYGWVAVAQVPYWVRVSIATFLQLSITWHNR